MSVKQETELRVKWEPELCVKREKRSSSDGETGDDSSVTLVEEDYTNETAQEDEDYEERAKKRQKVTGTCSDERKPNTRQLCRNSLEAASKYNELLGYSL